MNYFNLINGCLLESNFKTVEKFADLVTSDHLRIKNIMNRINNEICASLDWWFLEQNTKIQIPAGQVELPNTIDGKIKSIYVDGNKYTYNPNYEGFYNNSNNSCSYGLFNNKLLFSKFSQDKTATVFYISNKYAVDEEGFLKAEMTDEKDKSVIPAPFLEPLLVYGTSFRFKGMPDNPKYQHWNSEYYNALKNLRTESQRSQGEDPHIIIKGR